MNSTAKIYNINEPFPFDRLTLMKPFMRNGSYFIRIETAGMPLYIQPPKCELKQGFVKSGKKTMCDLVFSTENEKFIEWLERFEERCYLQIYDNREKWFDPVLEKHEIEDYMTSPYKMYKSGKYYIIRTDIPTNLGKCEIKIYDENEKEIEPETLSENTNAITIMELKGIKCSIRSFQFEIELKQMLVVEPSRMFEKLIIRENCGGSGGSIGGSSSGNAGLAGMATSAVSPQPFKINADVPQQRHDFYKRRMEREQKQKNRKEILEKKREALEKNAIEQPAEKYSLEPVEVELDLAKIEENPVHLKNKNDIYYEKYKEAKKKAKEAKIIALTNYLEAKRIKTTYLEELDLSDSDSEPQFDEDNDGDEIASSQTNLKKMLDIQEL